MKESIRKCLYRLVFFFQEKISGNFLKKHSPVQRSLLAEILKKYSSHFLIVTGLIFLSLISEFLPIILKKNKEILSLDTLVPKNFVLVPIEISNGKDIITIIGNYGVVDLYAYSKETGLPEKQAASAVKVLPPDTEGNRFVALIPESEASYLFKYSDPFYAVIQNPDKKGSKIYKKREKKSLIVIEENF